MGLDDVQEDVNMGGESDGEKEGGGELQAEPEVEDVEGKGNGQIAELDQGDEDDDEELEEESESDDSGSSSDDEEDMEISKQVEQVEALLTANVYSYDLHVQLISILRKAGQLEKLRAAREAMNVLYPLTPSMWREWASDEARLVSGAEDVRAVETLYERGIQDYASVSLWLEYLKFVEERDATVAEGSKDGVSKMRHLYERALAAVGLHFAEGGRVWEAYREFEQALAVLAKVSGGDGMAKQVEVVKSLFLRQLTIPLRSLSKTLEEYREWERQRGNHIGGESEELTGLPSHVSSAYKQAKQLCSIRELHENKILESKSGDAEQFQHYLGYISIEEATGEPARAQVLYERTVSAFPVSQDLWMKYIQYLEANLKVAVVLKSAYSRAVRNCPWVEPLWKSYLLGLERFGASEGEVSMVFEQSLQGGFQTAQEYLDLFLTRCDGLRRRIIAVEEGTSKQIDIQLLRTTFDRASQFLATYYPDFVDRTLQLHAYWADVEVQIANDLTAARGVWEGLIKSIGWMTEVWQAYISMELSLKNIKEVRAIYRSCYSRRLESNGTELMCSAWLRFEREHGTLEDYDRAVIKVGPRIAEVQVMQFKQDVKPTADFVEPGSLQAAASQRMGMREDASMGASDSPLAKRKRGLVKGERKPKLKKARTDKEAIQTQLKGKAGAQTASTVANDNHRQGAGDDQFMRASSGKDVVMDGASPKQSKGSKPPRQYTDECTAFVSNISFQVSVDQLTDFFSTVASVKEVRMLKDKFTGRPRGLAYVDFADEESLAAAVAKDKEELSGRKLIINRSNPAAGHTGRGEAGNRGGRQGRGRGADDQAEGNSGRGRGGVGLTGHRRGGKVAFTGSNTFAVPRNVKPLGWNPGQGTSGDEASRSNDEFRKMLLEKK